MVFAPAVVKIVPDLNVGLASVQAKYAGVMLLNINKRCVKKEVAPEAALRSLHVEQKDERIIESIEAYQLLMARYDLLGGLSVCRALKRGCAGTMIAGCNGV